MTIIQTSSVQINKMRFVFSIFFSFDVDKVVQPLFEIDDDRLFLRIVYDNEKETLF